MTAADQTRPPARPSLGMRRRLRPLARRLAPGLARAYALRRAREAEMASSLERLRDELERTAVRHGEQIERLESFVSELILTAEALRRAVGDAGATASWARRAVEPIADELYALPYMADSPFELLDSPVGEVLGYRTARALSEGGSDYAAFEDLFRGPAARVAQTQRPYLELVREHQPLLDAGCGRGEFLSLLAAEGIEGEGVDSDPGMVSRCQSLGLRVSLGDVNQHLDGLADASLGTIFSAQVIEHLPHRELTRMLELSVRKLKPGGLFIAETVNPHRLASLKTFWVDLTHQHPIFPEVALAACAIAGFESAYVFAPSFAGFEQARFKASAYAVVATAPRAAPVARQ